MKKEKIKLNGTEIKNYKSQNEFRILKNGLQKNINLNSGITLIALVITIIVLLILAGVSIATLTGPNGILTQANQAKEETEKASIEEQRKLAQIEANTHLTRTEHTEVVNGETKTVPIPAGFAMTNIEGESTIEEGLVITDAEGNEFVWIPVELGDDESTYEESYKKIKTMGASWRLLPEGNTNTVTIDNAIIGDNLGMPADKNLETVFGAGSTEATVVGKAHGFYVGRYEAGVETNEQIEWTYKTKVVSKAGVQPARQISQSNNNAKTDAIRISNNWLNGDGVKSGLITGTQWDAMCKFIDGVGVTEDKYIISNSSSSCATWGNYGDVASAPYTGYCSPDGSNLWEMVTDKVKSKEWNAEKNGYEERFVFPTGKFVTEKNTTTEKRNLYDVAGNVWEWTTEIPLRNDGNNRVIRGGGANNVSNVVATGRNGDYSASHASWYFGFRLALYVK